MAIPIKAKKGQRGRKPIPEKERIVALKIWVKKKYSRAAQAEINVVEDKYNAIPG